MTTSRQSGKQVHRKRQSPTLSRGENLRYLADALPLLVWIARADGYIEYYNQSCYDYTGMSRDELEGWGWQHVLHPDEVEVKLQRWAESLRTGQPFEIQYRLKKFDGSYRWHLGRALPFRDPAGEIISWFGTSTDIEAHKQAEHVLRETQQRLEQNIATRTVELTQANVALTEQIAQRDRVEQQLVEQSEILQSILANMGDAVVVADQQERFLVFNPAAERMFGSGAATTPSETWPRLYGLYLSDQTTLCSAATLALTRSIRGEDVNDEVVFIRHAKAPAGLWARVSGRPLRDRNGAVTGGVIVCRDITEHKRAQEEVTLLHTIIMEVAAAPDLTASLEIVLRRVCEKCGWAIGQAWLVSDDGEYLSCSPAWFTTVTGLERFRGVSESSRFRRGEGLPGRVWVSGQPAWILDVTTDGNFPRAHVAREVGLRGALAIPIVASGKVVAVLEFFVREPRHEDERLTKVIATVAAELDLVLERKQAVDALRDQEAVLRSSFERIQELAGGLLVAQEAERSRIARELHDDISQQLAALSLSISGLKRQSGVLDGGAIGVSLSTLHKRTLDLADSVRRLSHDLHPSMLQQVGLRAALESHCTEFQQQNGIDVTFYTAEDVTVVLPDAALCLYRAAQEALRNVAKHAEARRTQVVLSRENDELTLTIVDDGKGFDKALVHRRGGGLGLLSIEERARLLHGSVRIETAGQRGTIVRVAIPAAANRSPAAEFC
jgi:PAS domain S-box-containing protein